ncbi:S-adenosyl-L-methionine-dependent methyltransferase [Thermoascus aurantiacus ATCC 26904]
MAQSPSTQSPRAQSPPAQGLHAQSPPAENTLEVDEAPPDDNESAYNESICTASYVSSLSSSIKNYKYEILTVLFPSWNGRCYHAYHEGACILFLANDEEEQDCIDLLHHIYCLVLGGELFLAQIKNPQHVLDIGIGTGIWATQFADSIQPPWVPPNCIFEIDVFENDWVYQTPFDFIHGRELEGCVADEDRLFSQAFKHIKSGGYFEFDGYYAQWFSDDDTIEKAENCQLCMKNLHIAANKFGKRINNAPLWKERMEKAGFVDVKESVPIGPWPKDPKLKEIGRYQQIQQIMAVESYTPALFSCVLGWNQMELEVLMAKVQNELKDRSIHVYALLYFVYGRPFDYKRLSLQWEW